MLEHQTGYQTTSIQCSPPFRDYNTAKEYIMIQRGSSFTKSPTKGFMTTTGRSLPILWSSCPLRKSKVNCPKSTSHTATEIKILAAHWKIRSWAEIQTPPASPKAIRKSWVTQTVKNAKDRKWQQGHLCTSINTYRLDIWSWMYTFTSISIPPE